MSDKKCKDCPKPHCEKEMLKHSLEYKLEIWKLFINPRVIAVIMLGLLVLIQLIGGP